MSPISETAGALGTKPSAAAAAGDGDLGALDIKFL
jgi:hypothetical protein